MVTSEATGCRAAALGERAVEDNLAMRKLRHSRCVAKLVLAWWLVWIGFATLLPLRAQTTFDLICSGGSVKVSPEKTDQSAHFLDHVVQCAACVHADGSPPSEFAWGLQAQTGDSAPGSLTEVQVQQYQFAPWTARGPPSTS